jgi:hypothetical protein
MTKARDLANLATQSTTIAQDVQDIKVEDIMDSK